MEQAAVKSESKFEHTQGPWIVEKTTENLWVGTPKSYAKKVDEIVVKLDYDRYYKASFKAKQLANAKLIAAAPDLLTACQEMIKHLTETDFDVCGTKDEELNRWKEAIKKATE